MINDKFCQFVFEDDVFSILEDSSLKDKLEKGFTHDSEELNPYTLQTCVHMFLQSLGFKSFWLEIQDDCPLVRTYPYQMAGVVHSDLGDFPLTWKVEFDWESFSNLTSSFDHQD